MNVYLVSYYYTKWVHNDSTQTGFGNVEIESEAMSTFDDILKMQDEIAKKEGLQSVIVISWNKFEIR